jgi:glycosyltransferase involved in cell wall biosynthesis
MERSSDNELVSKRVSTELKQNILHSVSMPQKHAAISVLIAALNEEEGIGLTLDELQKNLNNPQLIVIDGKSVDYTVKIAENMGATVIIQAGEGKGDAIYQGLKQLGSNSQYVVFTDADYTYPAEFLPKMISALDHDPTVGMVIGNRFKGETNSQKSLSNPFYIGNRLLAFAQHAVNGINLDDPLSGLRVVRREILEGWRIKSKGFDVEVEMNYRVEQKGFKIIELPIDYRTRLGTKKLKLRHGLGILKRIVSESFYA